MGVIRISFWFVTFVGSLDLEFWIEKQDQKKDNTRQHQFHRMMPWSVKKPKQKLSDSLLLRHTKFDTGLGRSFFSENKNQQCVLLHFAFNPKQAEMFSSVWGWVGQESSFHFTRKCTNFWLVDCSLKRTPVWLAACPRSSVELKCLTRFAFDPCSEGSHLVKRLSSRHAVSFGIFLVEFTPSPGATLLPESFCLTRDVLQRFVWWSPR